MSEEQQLQELSQKPFGQRAIGYMQLGGPGWLQGAMTLGGGSAITSLTIGGVYGYEFLWVQPVAMIIGCIMLVALSHQTLSTGKEPFQAMRDHVHPILAWAWAIAALLSSIIWGFSHYPLSAGMIEEIVSVGTGYDLAETGGTKREIYLFGFAILVWIVCASTAWQYGRGGKLKNTFENGIKFLTGMIVVCFLWVVVSASFQGNVDWMKALAGFIPTSLPSTQQGVTTMMSALGSAVGINMTFVYGYTLLGRGWSKPHRELARYDIYLGLVMPYILITGLISIAAAAAFYDSDMELAGKLMPAQAASMFANAGLGEFAGRLIFAFGILGMAAGSLVMHMLCCGAAAQAMFGLKKDSLAYRLCLLLPTPAVLGVFLWSTMGPAVVLPTSAISGFLLPIAYIGWAALHHNKAYLGEDRPVGSRAKWINAAMGLCISLVIMSFAYSMYIRFLG